MKQFNFAKYAAICALFACANPKNRKEYIEALENQVLENNVNLSQRPGQTVEIRDQSGNIKKTPLIDKDGDGIAEGLDLDGDGVIDVQVMKGRHKKETSEKFTIEIDINNDGVTDYYFAVEKTASGFRITLVAANSTTSQQLTILQTSDVITGIDSTGDNVSDDNRLNGKNCTNTGSAPADSTAPSVPGSLTATAAGQNQINLTWTASTDNTSPTGNLVYEICQSTTAGGCDTFSVTFNSSAGATSFSATSLTALTTYYYRIRARDIAANRSATTGEQSATTQSAGTVANPTFSPTAGFFTAAQTVNLTSTTTGVTFCSTTNGSAPTCNSAGGCQTGTAGASVNISATATLKTVACRSGYVASAEVSGSYTIDSVAPGVPSSPSASAAGSDQVQLNWTAATDNTSAAANLVYEICQSTTSGACDTFSVTYTTGAGATSYLIGSLTPVTTYYFRVRSKDQAGNVGTPTAQQSATTTTAGTVSAPSFSPVAGTYNSTQNVTITSSTSGALICYTTNGSTPACNTTPTCTTGTTYSAAVAISSTADLRAIACKAVMTNSSVTLGSFTIDTVAPANVTSFTATAGSNQVALAWTNPGDADFAGVKVLRKTGSYPTDQNDGTTVYNGTGTSYTNTGLTAATQYYFKAFSYDTAGNYAAGAQATATPVAPGTALWARSQLGASNRSEFKAATSDSAGNIYAVGYQTTTGSFNYGNSVLVSGSGGENIILVKYNSSGNAQWAKSVISGSTTTTLNGVALDASNNILAVGRIYNTTTATFATGVTATGTAISFNSPLIIKFDSNGTALWAKSTSASSDNVYYNSVSVDSAGNSYAVGYQQGTTNVNYGDGVSQTGIHTSQNAIIVKYSPSGTVLWARTPTAGPGWSEFYATRIDSSGSIYAVGVQACTGSPYTYGTGVTATGTGGSCAVIVKYNSSGTALWARSVESSGYGGAYRGIAFDSSNNVYVAGNQNGTAVHDYGSGVTSSSPYGGSFGSSPNILLVKYDSNGTALWARTIPSATGETRFTGITLIDNAIYAAGWQDQSGTFTYAVGPTVSNPSCRTVIAKYDLDGAFGWVKGNTTSATCGVSHYSFFNHLTEAGGYPIAVGLVNGTSTFTFASSATTTGGYSAENAALIKFAP